MSIENSATGKKDLASSLSTASNLFRRVKIFSCNANIALAEDIASQLGLPIGKSTVSKFSDGEISTRIFESIRGADVYIIQSIAPPVNDNLMELLILTDAMRRASAGTINAVIPYFGYARQDRKARARDPISAKLVANMIVTAGVDRVISMDLHCSQIQGFFDIPVDHLLGVPILAEYYIEKFNKKLENFVVVSPDFGNVPRARAFAAKLDTPLAIIDKRRPRANVSEVMNIIGEVNGKDVILCDDMVDTAGSMINATNALIEKGARNIYACCTHPLLSGQAVERIMNSPIIELVALNTIAVPEEKRFSKLVTRPVSKIFAEAIQRIHSDLSVSELFENR